MDLNKKIDLHMHSIYSDGTKTPAELVKIAKGAGLFCISLTDHDCIDGLSELKNAAASNGIEIIEGVELSLKYKCTLHMLAYFPNGGISKMQPFFDKLKKERSERNPKILDALNRLGYNISFDDVLAEAGDSHVIGRLHFAKALISRNYVKSINEAFDLLLGENKPAYFEKENISPKDAIKSGTPR